MELEAVLFDLDGTLVDTAPDFYVTVEKLLALHNKAPIEHEVIRAEVSNGSRALTKLCFPEITDQDEFEQLRMQLLNIYADEVGANAVLFPENREILETLKSKNIPWGIVTNKPRLYTELLIKRTSFLKNCSVLICADDVPVAKPDPTGILEACAKLQVSSNKVLYVGDHVRDVQAAHNAGCVSAIVPFGYFDEGTNLNDIGAQHLLRNAKDLMQLLDN